MSNAYYDWMARNPPDRQTKLLIDQWWEAEGASTDSQSIQDAAEEWMADGTRPKPDLVKCLALYGRSRLLTQGWTELPIRISEAEHDDWRRAGLEPTLEDHRDYQAAAIGGFLQLMGRYPLLIMELVQQLQQKRAQLDELLARPLKYYTPEDWDKLVDEGVEIDDGEFVELRALDEPFVIYEDLASFAWAMEKARMFALSEHDEELGLPNPELHEALMQVDVNDLYRQLEATDPKLRRIWRHLADHNYYKLNSDVAPDRFWWRHWKVQSRGKRRQTS